MTTIKGIKRFFAPTARRGLMAVACLMAGGALAAGFDGMTLVTNNWFAADFTGLTADTVISQGDTTGITSGTGSWTAVPTTGTAQIAADADAGGEATLLSINAEEGELTFTPAALATATGMATVAVDVKTIAVDTLSTPEGGAQGAFAIYSTNGVDHSLAAYVSDGTAGVWTNLVYASAADLTNVWLTLTLDFATVSNVRYVRYSITPPAGSLTILADTAGTQWFCSADDDATTVESVSFTGTGNIRTFSGDSLAETAATCNGINYASVADAIAAAEDGAIIEAQRNVSNETLNVTKNVTVKPASGKTVYWDFDSITVAEGATLTCASWNKGATVRALSGGGNIVSIGNTLNLTLSGDSYSIGSITANAGMLLQGYGTVNVTGDVSVTGELKFLNTDSYSSAAAKLHEGAYTIKLAAESVACTTLSGYGTVETTDGVTAGGTSTFYGTIAGSGGVTANGTSLSLYGPNSFTGALTVSEGTVNIDSSLSGITQLVHLDATDTESIIKNENDYVTNWVSTVGTSTINFTNETAVGMTVVNDYFGGKPAVLTNAKTLWTQELRGSRSNHPGSFYAVMHIVETPTSVAFWRSASSNRGIGKHGTREGWRKQTNGSNSTSDNIWNNGKYADPAPFLSTDQTFAVVGWSRLSTETAQAFGGGGGSLAIGELVAIAESTGNLSIETGHRIENYLAQKWGVDNGMKSLEAVPVVLANGSTLDLGGLAITVSSVSGSGTVQNGTLTVTEDISVAVGDTLVIPYGSTYTLADDGTYEVVDSVGGTVTITHCAADIDGTPYDTVAGAIAAYTSGKLTIHEDATLDLGTTEVNISGIVLDEGVELTLTQNAPWQTKVSEGTLVNTRVASTYVWTPGGVDTNWATLSNWRIGEATPVALPGANDTVVFPAEKESWTVSLDSDQTVTNMIVNGTLTLSNSTLTAPLISGNGLLRLSGVSLKGNGSVATNLVNTEIVENTTNYLVMNGKNYALLGNLSGSGTLVANHGNTSSLGVHFAGDNCEFCGEFQTINHNSRDRTAFEKPESASSNAVYRLTVNIGNGSSDGYTLNPVNGDGGTYYLGAYIGVAHWSEYKIDRTIVIGARSDVDSDYTHNTRVNRPSGYVRKIGEGYMAFSGNPYTLTLEGGTTLVRPSPGSQTALTFAGEGATLQLGTTVSNDSYTYYDPSSAIKNSTFAIIFDDLGTNYTWSTALDASNTAGLVKKGAGTLTLSAAPRYTGTTTVEAGTLVVTNGTSAWEYTLGADTKASLAMDGDIYVYTLTPLTSTEKPEAIEGVITVPESMNGVSAVYAIAPGESIDCSALTTATGIKATVSTTVSVSGETVDMTSYYTSSSLGVVNGLITPQLDKNEVGVDFGDNVEEPVVFASEKPTFKLKNSVKKGLYYSVGTISDPSEANPDVTVVVEAQATADGEAISLEVPSMVFDSGNVLYYKLSVSDTAQRNTP